ncbi:hypothetical protein D3C87_1851950 [compost metagenome]
MLDPIAKGRLFGHAFGPCIDQKRKLARVLDPAGHEAPAGKMRLAAALGFPDGEDRLGGRDIVARHDLDAVEQLEQLHHHFGRQGRGVATTHWRVSFTRAEVVSTRPNRKSARMASRK